VGRYKEDLHVTVDPQVLKAARKKRKETGRSLSHVVETALRRWIAEELLVVRSPRDPISKGGE